MEQLAESGQEVTVLARDPARIDVVSDSVTVEEGDARDPGAVKKLATNQAAVCSCLGVRPSGRPVTLFSESTTHLLEAIQGRTTRLLVITGVGAGDSRGHGGSFYDKVLLPLLLRRSYEDKDRQELLLTSSAANWTIIRPATLTNGARTGEYRVLTELEGVTLGRISRTDVAHFMVAELVKPVHERRIVNLTY